MASVITNFGKRPLLRLFNHVLKEARAAGHMAITRTQLVYHEYGEPSKVITSRKEDVSVCLEGDCVLLKVLASPINPADINTIQGVYPERPTLPAVPGTEAVAEVIDVGNQVHCLSVGDHVVVIKNMLGTWSTHMVVPDKYLLKVPKKLGLIEAATLSVNPCTAYRMLRDFVDLKPGETVLQNGANSAVGQAVIQICKAWGLNTVNIVRDRPDIGKLKEYLKCLGGTYVLTEEELRTTDLFKCGRLPKPRLALNCVGGKSSMELLRHLQNSCAMVTYGGMSRDPILVPTSAMIFKDTRLYGFWMTHWSKCNFDSVERMEMFEELICMLVNCELKAPRHTLVPFAKYKDALVNTMSPKGMAGVKYILDMSCS